MSKLSNFLKKQGFEEFQHQLVHAGLVLLVTYGAPVVTFVAGYLQGGIPLPYLFAAAALVFAGVAAGINNVRALMFQMNPEGKLHIAANQVGKRYLGKK